MSKKEIKREVNKAFDKKVFEKIQYYLSDEFSKLLILETANAVYWAKENFKSKYPIDVAKYNGVKIEDTITVEANSSYGSSEFEVFMFEPNNKYFYRIRYYVGCRVTGSYWGNRLGVRFSHIIKVYPDKCFQVTEKITDFELFEDSINNSKLYTRRESKRWMGNVTVYSDLDTKIVKNPASTSGWRKEVSDSTFEKIKEFFRNGGVNERCLGEFDKHVVSINNFLNKANILSNGTALDTREKLLTDTFIPMYNKVKEWMKAKLGIPCKEYDEWLARHKDQKDCRIQYNKMIRPCLVRDGDWIMCIESLSTWSKVVFYNAKLKKKYMANVHSEEINNYGVFNIDYFNVFPSSSSYYNHHNTYFINHYDYHLNYNINFLTDDFETTDSMKMYDIDGNEISYKECFKDTPIISVVECAKPYVHAKLLNYCLEELKKENISKANEVIKRINVNDHTIENIVNQNMIPIEYFLILCLKKDYQLAAEQLAKSGYNGILYQMVTDQNTFKGKDEEPRRYWSAFVLFDKTQTNLKGYFNMSVNQLKAIDKWIDSNSGNNISIVSFPEMLFGKDKVRSIDEQTFGDILKYFHRCNVSKETVQGIAETLESIGYKHLLNNPKEALTIFNKVGDLQTWKDYLNMVHQLQELIKTGVLEMDMKKYKVIPDKSTRYIHLREMRRQYCWGNQNPMISTAEQYDNLTQRYNHIKPAYDENGKICGAIIEASVSEHVRFLHDELSCLIPVYRNKEKDKLFKVAAERVKKYEWENNDIAIIAPKQAADVVNDAHTLSHCAASFVDPIINGTENIMFIRKKHMKDIPWYTMAIDNNGNIEQIHSYQNSHLTIADQQDCLQRSGIPSYMEQIDLVPMLKKWAKEKGINVASVKERYGALCARC